MKNLSILSLMLITTGLQYASQSRRKAPAVEPLSSSFCLCVTPDHNGNNQADTPGLSPFATRPGISPEDATPHEYSGLTTPLVPSTTTNLTSSDCLPSANVEESTARENYLIATVALANLFELEEDKRKKIVQKYEKETKLLPRDVHEIQFREIRARKYLPGRDCNNDFPFNLANQAHKRDLFPDSVKK